MLLLLLLVPPVWSPSRSCDRYRWWCNCPSWWGWWSVGSHCHPVEGLHPSWPCLLRDCCHGTNPSTARRLAAWFQEAFDSDRCDLPRFKHNVLGPAHGWRIAFCTCAIVCLHLGQGERRCCFPEDLGSAKLDLGRQNGSSLGLVVLCFPHAISYVLCKVDSTTKHSFTPRLKSSGLDGFRSNLVGEVVQDLLPAREPFGLDHSAVPASVPSLLADRTGVVSIAVAVAATEAARASGTTTGRRLAGLARLA